MPTVVNVPERNRYELCEDGSVLGVADYTRNGNVLDVHHTEIDPRQRGRGLGAVLVDGMLELVRAEGLRVVPSCWFVRDHFDAHPELADLRA